MPNRSAESGSPLDSDRSSDDPPAVADSVSSLAIPPEPQLPSSLRFRQAGEADRKAWDEFVARSPAGDPLQTWGWGEAVATGGRERPNRVVVEDGSGGIRGLGQILVRSASFNRQVLYLPHGPVWDAAYADGEQALSALLDGIRDVGQREGGIVAKVDLRATADLPLQLLTQSLAGRGLRRSRFDLQARTTRLLDLAVGEEALFASLEKDTRNSIRRSTREGVTTRVVRDADPSAVTALWELMSAMGERARVRVRSATFLSALLAKFAPGGASYLVLAEREGRPIAGCLALTTGPRAFYLYAGSLRTAELKHAFGAYAALWALCQALIADGRTSLDLWGVSEKGDPDTDPRWEGYSLFKRGFGGTPLRHPGVYDLVLDPIWYWIRDWRERLAFRRGPAAHSS